MDHALLTFAMNDAWFYLHRLLAGLSDHEFFWEPVPNCWRIRQSKPGTWGYDYQIPPPQPAPLTTIGWRLVHIAACKIMYFEYAFGAGKLTFPELVIPHTAADAVTWLEQGHALLPLHWPNAQAQPWSSPHERIGANCCQHGVSFGF